MENFNQVSEILKGFYEGTISTVEVEYHHPEDGFEFCDHIESGEEFIDILRRIYDYGYEIKYNINP